MTFEMFIQQMTEIFTSHTGPVGSVTKKRLETLRDNVPEKDQEEFVRGFYGITFLDETREGEVEMVERVFDIEGVEV